MTDKRSSSTDHELLAINPFHDWWIAELRSSIAPTATDVETEPETEAEGSKGADEGPRRTPPTSNGKLLFICATCLFWGAAAVVLIDGKEASGSSAATTAIPQVEGIVEVGEIRVVNQPATALDLPTFDRKAALQGVNEALDDARACTKGKPAPTSRIAIVFDPSGQAQDARFVGGALRGTTAGHCIAGRLKHVRVPAFRGEGVTVYKTVR